MRTPARAWIVVGLFGASLALGGCGGSGGQGGTAATAAPAMATEAPVAPASDEPAGSAAPGGAAETEITANGIVVPKTIGSVAYATSEFAGDQLAMLLPFKADDLDAVLEAQGLKREDVIMAVAVPDDPALPAVTAIRLAGGDATALAKAVQEGSYGNLDFGKRDIGGKSVDAADGATGVIVPYPSGEVMYLVLGTAGAGLESVLAALP